MFFLRIVIDKILFLLLSKIVISFEGNFLLHFFPLFLRFYYFNFYAKRLLLHLCYSNEIHIRISVHIYFRYSAWFHTTLPRLVKAVTYFAATSRNFTQSIQNKENKFDELFVPSLSLVCIRVS